jgi:hypothetical protein
MSEFEGPCKPGEVRNPEGKNGKTPITDSLKALLSRLETDPLDDEPMTNAQRIALEWAKKAKAGEMPAIISLTERTEGKTPDTIRHEGGDKPMETRFTMDFRTGPQQIPDKPTE